VKYWEITADNLSKAAWSWGCVATVDSNGRTIWIADAHRDDGKRLVVRADEKLTAFVELELAILRKKHGGLEPQKIKARHIVAGTAKSLLDYVTRRFNESSAALKASVRLGLRWDTAWRDHQIQLEP